MVVKPFTITVHPNKFRLSVHAKDKMAELICSATDEVHGRIPIPLTKDTISVEFFGGRSKVSALITERTGARYVVGVLGSNAKPIDGGFMYRGMAPERIADDMLTQVFKGFTLLCIPSSAYDTKGTKELGFSDTGVRLDDWVKFAVSYNQGIFCGKGFPCGGVVHLIPDTIPTSITTYPLGTAVVRAKALHPFRDGFIAYVDNHWVLVRYQGNPNSKLGRVLRYGLISDTEMSTAVPVTIKVRDGGQLLLSYSNTSSAVKFDECSELCEVDDVTKDND